MNDMEVDEMERDIPLPDELLTEIIFQFIPMCQWSSCLEYVSKQFQNCVFVAYGRVKSLNLRKMFSLKWSIKSWETQLIKNGLRSRCYFWEEPTMSAMLNNILKKLLLVCPNLIEISGFNYISRSVSVDTWNILNEFNRLQVISLHGMYDDVSSKQLANFLVSCKNLKILNVSNCDFYIGSGRFDLSSLTGLNIRDSYTFTQMRIFLDNISDKLTVLKIHNFGSAFKSIQDAKQAMNTCTKLESLSLSIFSQNEYQLFCEILPNLRKLTNLCVSGSANQPVHSIVLDEQFCAQLELVKNQLQFVEFNSICLSDEVIKFLLRKCTNLQSIKFDGKSAMSSDGLRNLTTLPCNLKELAFSTTREQMLPFLWANLVKLSNFTDLSINIFGEATFTEDLENISCLNHLQNLRLHGAWVTDALLEKWDKQNENMFKKLVSLDIRFCRRVTDVGALLLANKAINMENLILCSARITDKTIFKLSDVAKKLKVANFVQNEPLLFDENVILHFVQKAVCLKTLAIDKELAKKVVQHNDFQHLIENVEIIP